MTGPGGTGKTRLAVEAARELRERFEDGAFVVDLAPLRQAADVVPAIAAVLGVRQPIGGKRPIGAMLADNMQRLQALLLLDNFEHVSDATGEVAGLVASAPRVRMLITSRRSLHIPGGKEYPVPPLAVRPGASPGEADIRGCESVRLLAERATSVRPDFVVTQDNAPVLGEICAHLDGLPLAIELAAPRLRLLSPEDLARRLSDRLAMLAGPLPGAPARQQTLRRTLDWSYDLLEEGDRRLFARFAVFSGGASVDAAEEVCRGGPEDPDVLAGLASLAEQSLLRRDEADGETRLQMLETILEYARERLDGSGEAESTGERHAAFFLRLSERAEAQINGCDQKSWMERMGRELHNCGAAMAWLLERRRADESLRLAAALRWFHHRRGSFGLGARWLQDALALPEGAQPSVVRARALDALGWMVFVQGDWRRAHSLYVESVAVARSLAARAVESEALSDLGVAERWLGSDAEGTGYCERAVEIARGLQDPVRLARALIYAYGTTGGRAVGSRPREGLEEAVQVSRRAGDLWGLAHGLNSLGDTLREAGQHAEACSRYEGALQGFLELGDRWMTAWTFEGLGRALVLAGRSEAGGGPPLQEPLAVRVPRRSRRRGPRARPARNRSPRRRR